MKQFKAVITNVEMGDNHDMDQIWTFMEYSTRVDDLKLEEVGVEKFLQELCLYNKGEANLLGTNYPWKGEKIKLGDDAKIQKWKETSVFNVVQDTRTGGVKSGWSVAILPL